MQTWSFVPDKASWGDGPWVDEPDKAQWRAECAALAKQLVAAVACA